MVSPFSTLLWSYVEINISDGDQDQDHTIWHDNFGHDYINLFWYFVTKAEKKLQKPLTIFAKFSSPVW